MTYPNLTAALNAYAAYLQSTFKEHVQVRTGALRDSIKVWCTVNGQEYQLHIDLNHYWKYLPDPFPINSAFSLLEQTTIPNTSRRYPLDIDYWQKQLNGAFELDVQLFIEELGSRK